MIIAPQDLRRVARRRALDLAADPPASPAVFGSRVVPDYQADYAHVRALDDAILRILAPGGRLVITLPVRHGKSMLASQFLPAWFLSTWPKKTVALATYGAVLAEEFAGKARDAYVASGGRLGGRASGAARVAQWRTTKGGTMYAVGIGGALTGRGADLLIIDDPVKSPEEARSELHRRKVWEWFQSTAMTRLNPGGSAIVIMSRWHLDDLAGRLLAMGGWDHLHLLAIAGDDDPLGRSPGEALWPEVRPIEELNAIRETVGDRWFSALYQGIPLAGPTEAIFSPDDAQLEIPEGHAARSRRFATADTALSLGEDASYTVFGLWDWDGRDLALVDLRRARIEAPEQIEWIRWALDQGAETVGIENTLHGKALIQAAKRERLSVEALPAGGDKVGKATRAAYLWRTRRIHIADKPWRPAFLDEIYAFPFGAHDDQVDMMSHAAMYAGGENVGGIIDDDAEDEALRALNLVGGIVD